MSTNARRLIILGRVQGVGYRDTMRRRARALGLAGWVRNRRDGSVEAIAKGTPDDLDALVAWAWRGPPLAQVRSVTVETCDLAENSLGDFDIQPTV